MSFLGLFLFAGMNAEGEGSTQTANAFYEETNLGDFWIYGRIFTQEDVEEVQNIKGVIMLKGVWSHREGLSFREIPRKGIRFICQCSRG